MTTTAPMITNMVVSVPMSCGYLSTLGFPCLPVSFRSARRPVRPAVHHSAVPCASPALPCGASIPSFTCPPRIAMTLMMISSPILIASDGLRDSTSMVTLPRPQAASSPGNFTGSEVSSSVTCCPVRVSFRMMIGWRRSSHQAMSPSPFRCHDERCRPFSRDVEPSRSRPGQRPDRGPAAPRADHPHSRAIGSGRSARHPPRRTACTRYVRQCPSGNRITCSSVHAISPNRDVVKVIAVSLRMPGSCPASAVCAGDCSSDRHRA